MTNQRHVLIDINHNFRQDDSCWESAAGERQWRISLRTLQCGVSAGVDVLEVQTERGRFEILPTRGMSLWRATIDGISLGWRSPLEWPVHPRHVPIGEPSGFGFLDGPTELMFRCGLENAGVPDFGVDGRLSLPLHGRIANLPAHFVAIEIDNEDGVLRVYGQVFERRFLRQKLLLTTEYLIPIDGNCVGWTDTVKNLSATPALMQMMYHTNLGEPFLEGGAEIHAPVRRICPRDAISAAPGIERWNIMPPPDADSWEQAYFVQMLGEEAGDSHVVVSNPSGDSGIGLCFNVKDLPYFSVWRNTQASEDGYALGIEPGTNFPNPRSFEEQYDRIVRLAPGATWNTSLKLEAYCNSATLKNAKERVQELQSKTPPDFLAEPAPEWAHAIDR